MAYWVRSKMGVGGNASLPLASFVFIHYVYVVLVVVSLWYAAISLEYFNVDLMILATTI